MVKYRHRLVLERMQASKPRTVLEVGCGAELLYQKYHKSLGSVSAWVIVEPSKVFAKVAGAAGLPNVTVINRAFEAVESEIHDAIGEGTIDFISEIFADCVIA